MIESGEQLLWNLSEAAEETGLSIFEVRFLCQWLPIMTYLGPNRQKVRFLDRDGFQTLKENAPVFKARKGYYERADVHPVFKSVQGEKRQ